MHEVINIHIWYYELHTDTASTRADLLYIICYHKSWIVKINELMFELYPLRPAT